MLNRSISYARDNGHDIIGVWLGEENDVDPGVLEQAGFTRGWKPCWMTAPLNRVPVKVDPRVRLEHATPGNPDARSPFGDSLALTTLRPPTAWCAGARDQSDGTPIGRAWAFRENNLAGIFDMEVLEPFQRQGIGTALLSSVCQAAAAAGATDAVLNATPDGKRLYQARGFTQVGSGNTWWNHLKTRAQFPPL
ncbi:GNAT family N-acetyltransferase [Gordonia sp. (in: high G+C Gram-positive bacteria)]|uniref:GNAT family N-acetyltransferase n=1 Tax=Gordonia sp. (in: high G+C Gram-positive bacteria) TaxID=84139 RepID=UPI0039E3A226